MYVISENLIIRNEFNSYNMDWNRLCIFKINCHNQYYMRINWVAIEFIPYNTMFEYALILSKEMLLIPLWTNYEYSNMIATFKMRKRQMCCLFRERRIMNLH